DRTTIEAQIKAVQDVSAKDDVNAIHEATQNLQNATYALSQQMYNQDNSAANGGSDPYGSGNGNANGEDVVEGDFTEA
ncbi:MAG TPA: hypothetical protein VHD90_25185, partial [Phototrophicaceae bacterium]|nr:hypothetical protein [Phototrophicaceae bacterium]